MSRADGASAGVACGTVGDTARPDAGAVVLPPPGLDARRPCSSGDPIRMIDWLPALVRTLAAGDSAVLLTIVHTVGSTPREAGTTLLVTSLPAVRPSAAEAGLQPVLESEPAAPTSKKS